MDQPRRRFARGRMAGGLAGPVPREPEIRLARPIRTVPD